MYRPQFPYPAAPKGFVWQPCVYEFDVTNTRAFTLSLATDQETGWLPMKLDSDAPFVLKAVKISRSGLNVILKDPHENELMNTFLDPVEYANDVPPFTILEGPGIECPPGSTFKVRLQGQ